MTDTYESLQNLLEKIEDEYYNIEDEETDEDIIERRNDNLDELRCAVQRVICEMSDYEVEEDEIEELKQEG
jgi:hypothetical protein